MAELTCGEIVGDQGLSRVGNRDAHLTWDIDIDTLHRLVLFLRIDRLGRGHCLKVLYYNIIRCTSEIVLIEKSELLGEAEKDITLDLLIGYDSKDVLGRILADITRKKRGQHTVLQVELMKHQPQLIAVLRHIVGLTTYQQVPALTDLVDILCRQFGHLCRTASRKNLLAHETTGIGQGLTRSSHKALHRGILHRIGINGQEHSIVRETYIGGYGLGIELHGVALSRIGYGHWILLDADYAVGNRRLGRHIAQTQEAFGIATELTRLVGSLFNQEGDIDGSLREEVDGSLARDTRLIEATHGLRL